LVTRAPEKESCSYLNYSYLFYCLYTISSEVTPFAKMLVRLGFSTATVGYLIRDAGISSLEEIAYFDVYEVEVLINF
jgi:hypothetical protein